MAEKIGCLFCKHANELVRDNHGDLHTICACAESEHFLTPIDIVFGDCDCAEREEDEEDG